MTSPIEIMQQQQGQGWFPKKHTNVLNALQFASAKCEKKSFGHRLFKKTNHQTKFKEPEFYFKMLVLSCVDLGALCCVYVFQFMFTALQWTLGNNTCNIATTITKNTIS